MVQAGPSDVVYDLGCGDGRIVIAAARECGARGVGIDIDPARISDAQRHAAEAGVNDRVRFIAGDMFQLPVHAATVVALYLFPSVLVELREKLIRELPRGARIVSHSFVMGTWEPDCKLRLPDDVVYMWRVK
jgi:ubiquinone/menaquinone biosynthesis C-methylase UbiE